jgi:uncharacterized membrane-anchored protein YhcB (DUF1043 family)
MNIDLIIGIVIGLLLALIAICFYMSVIVATNDNDNVSNLIEKQSSKLDDYFKESTRINKILHESEEDCVIIDGVKYIKVPKPTHYWKEVE